MAGRAGRTYKRDGRGRFASTGGGGSKKPKARMVSKGTNRLTRDNSGRITSVGGDGATVRGGRLKTASGKQRGTQVARLQGAGGRLRGGRPVAAVPANVKPKKAAGRMSKKAAAEAKLDRVISRVSDIGLRRFTKDGRSEKARNAIRVQQRAVSWINGLGNSTRKPPKTVAEMRANAAKAMTDRKKVRASGELRRSISSYTNAISRSRAQRAPQFTREAIKQRQERAWASDKRKRGGLTSKATSRASEIYGEQLTGRMERSRSAAMPYGIKNRASAEKRANQIRLARAGKPVGGASKRIKAASTNAKGVVKSSLAAKGAQRRTSARTAQRLKLDPMQRSEAAYAKRKYGVKSTISNPGQKSKRLPRRTMSTGERIAVRGDSAATKRSYRARVTGTLGQTRKTDMTALGIGTRLRKLPNQRLRREDTGMRQLTITGGASPLYQYRRVKAGKAKRS